MTPELRTACEVVFQQHKSSAEPINWNKDVFRGRVSIGLLEMARQTLVRRDVICFPNPSKRVITTLNPNALGAATCEEAFELVQRKTPLASTVTTPRPTYVASVAHRKIDPPVQRSYKLVRVTSQAEAPVYREKWYMTPVFYYGVWPVCAGAVGILVAYLLGSSSF